MVMISSFGLNEHESILSTGKIMFRNSVLIKRHITCMLDHVNELHLASFWGLTETQ